MNTRSSEHTWRHQLAYLWYQLKRSPMTLIGIGIIFTMCLLAILALVIALYAPDAINLRASLQAPSFTHFFGTDEVGRDIFSRVLYGGQQSIGVGVFVALVASIIGSTIG